MWEMEETITARCFDFARQCLDDLWNGLIVFCRQDLAFVRQFRGLEKRIAQDGPPPCEVQLWHGAWQVEQLFLKLGESK
jgi:hypothetical protein